MAITILVADDEENIVKTLSKKLTLEGYAILEARTGSEALKKTSENFPDLILLDVSMPDMDGAEVARFLHNRQVTSQIPIIFLTGMLSKNDGEADNQIWIDGRSYPVLTKPFQFTELLAKIRDVLE